MLSTVWRIYSYLGPLQKHLATLKMQTKNSLSSDFRLLTWI